LGSLQLPVQRTHVTAQQLVLKVTWKLQQKKATVHSHSHCLHLTGRQKKKSLHGHSHCC